MDDATTGVDDEATPEVDTPGVDDDVPDTANKSDEAKIEPTNVEHTSSAMNLHRQPIKIQPQELPTTTSLTSQMKLKKTVSYSCSSNAKKTQALFDDLGG